MWSCYTHIPTGYGRDTAVHAPNNSAIIVVRLAKGASSVAVVWNLRVVANQFGVQSIDEINNDNPLLGWPKWLGSVLSRIGRYSYNRSNSSK